MKFCEEYGLILIEDCAEALGASYNGRKVGTFGIGCFSFSPNKPITCGEGGIVCTNDEEQAKLIKALRNLGKFQEAELNYQILGFNYRMTDLAASIGLVQLRKINEVQNKRKAIAIKYNNLLKEFLSNKILLPKFTDERSWFVYVIQVDNRDEVSLKLRKKGIETRNYFPCIHLQPPYVRLGYREGQYPIAESVSKRTLALPFYTSMTEEEVEYVVENLKKSLSE